LLLFFKKEDSFFFRSRPLDVFIGHARLFIAIAIGAASLFLLPHRWPPREAAIAAWDIGSAAYLLLIIIVFSRSPPARMEVNARAQEAGEWTLFFLVLAGATASFAAIIGEFSSMKDATGSIKAEKIAIVAATLALSWLLTQAAFALRYAHEFYSRASAAADIDGGLEFPSESKPDYWDFLYFSVVLGMTFQVSDVQITSRKLRRLATLHGLLGFLFNTVIIALTVNLASGLL
jgi:uncharacterized membrane protein